MILPRITVRAGNEKNRVALNERHPDHPAGHAWITGNGQEHQVAVTQGVAAAIASGALVVVLVPAEPGPAAPPKPAPTTTTGQVAASARRKGRGNDEPAHEQ